MLTETSPQTHPVPSQAVLLFFLITFAVSLGLIGSYVFWPAAMSGLFGELSGAHPIFFLATWAPAIAGFIVVIRSAGLQGLGRYLGRLFLWRCPPIWWAFILIGIPIVFAIGSLIKGGQVLAPVPPEGVGAVFAVLFIMLFLGPVEEFGWRGVAQPLLQRYMAPLWAATIIGLAWGVWHLPAFFLTGVVFAEWSFLPFLIGNVALSILVTPIFNASRGSLLLPVLFHWQLINPFWPDAQPWDTWILTAIAVGVVWFKREEMLSREGAVTEVVPGRSGDDRP